MTDRHEAVHLLVEEPGAALGKWIVRCARGVAVLGMRFEVAADPTGVAHPVDLVCEQIERYEGIMVDSLHPSEVAAVVLSGPPVDIASGWTLGTV